MTRQNVRNVGLFDYFSRVLAIIFVSQNLDLDPALVVGSGSSSDKNQNPDPHPDPHQGYWSNPDPHPDPHQRDADPQHCLYVTEISLPAFTK
jgi:hypothetical protein